MMEVAAMNENENEQTTPTELTLQEILVAENLPPAEKEEF